jgi:hypothetical protein
VYRRAPGTRLLGGHAVTVIGWDSAQQYWLAKNSWGPSGGGAQRLRCLSRLSRLRCLSHLRCCGACRATPCASL